MTRIGTGGLGCGAAAWLFAVLSLGCASGEPGPQGIRTAKPATASAQAAPRSAQPFEWHHEEDGLTVDVSLVLGPRQLVVTAPGDPASTLPQRFMRYEIGYSVGAIRVQENNGFGPLPADSTRALEGRARTLSRAVAKGMAYDVLGQAPPAGFDGDGEEVGGFHVTLSPRSGLTWGQVEAPDDVSVLFEREPAPTG